MKIHSIAIGYGAPRARGKRLLAALSLLAACTLSGHASAATSLQDVKFAALPGNQVRVELVLSGPVSAPRTFATESPARIALDLEGVTSGLESRTVPVNVGPVHSVAAVEASNRTRVVINLNDSVPYEVSTSGNRVTVAVNGRSQPEPARRAAPPAPSAATAAAAGAQSAPSGGAGLRDIDFQRGPGGEGRVLITLPSPTTRVAVTERGDRVVADIMDTALPTRLLRRLDVTDFATPVTAVESRPEGGNVRIEVQTTDEYDYLAYQADNLFTLEFRPLTKAEKEELRKSKVVYTGDRLSLNFQDIEVRAVLQLLADFTGLNLVASDTVRGNITLRLKNVPWDQALDIILKSKGLSMRQTGNVIMVAPTQEIAAQEKLELESQNQIEELAPLRSEFIQVNYAKAADFAAMLKSAENKLLSERGNVTVDTRTNTLLVQDTAAKLEEIRRLIGRLDVAVRQVMIESRIVIANDDFARDLGVRFGFSRFDSDDDGNFNNIAGGNPGHLTGTGALVPGVEIPAGVAPLWVNLPVTDPSGAVNFLIGKVGSYLLQLELSAMQREGRGEIVSSPRVITSDQSPASIKVGQEIPYQQASASGATNVAFKEAVLKLEVTPHITPDDRIIMDLQVNKDNPDFTRELGGIPPVDTRSVETSVLVDNGETVVLGGVYEREKTYNKEQVPWLGDVPILGALFKTTSRQDNNEELLIFVTPRILKEDLATR